MLDEPQHRVGHHVVELLVGLGVGLHQPDPVGGSFELAVEAAAAVLRGRLGILVGQRGGDPQRVAVVDQACEGGHQAAAAALGLQAPVLFALEGGGAAVRDQHELGLGAHCRSLKIRSQSRAAGA